MDKCDNLNPPPRQIQLSERRLKIAASFFITVIFLFLVYLFCILIEYPPHIYRYMQISVGPLCKGGVLKGG